MFNYFSEVFTIFDLGNGLLFMWWRTISQTNADIVVKGHYGMDYKTRNIFWETNVRLNVQITYMTDIFEKIN